MAVCTCLGLTGRIRLAREGINGTLGGSPRAVELYVLAMVARRGFGFRPEDFKTGLGTGGATTFPNLWIKVCQEICHLGLSPSLVPPSDSTSHLSPTEFHAAVQDKLQKKRDDVVLLDCRNFYEWQIGRFEGALLPDTRNFAEFPACAEEMVGEHALADKTVLMYCTGGIRCERASNFLRQSGVEKVFQLSGGIHKYVEQYGAEGYFGGKLFVFDRRVGLHCGSDEVVGRCSRCDGEYDTFDREVRCSGCRVLVLVCTGCREQQEAFACHRCRLQGPSGTRTQGVGAAASGVQGKGTCAVSEVEFLGP